MQHKADPSVWKHLKRGLGYSLFSLFALLSGLIMKKQYEPYSNIIILVIVYILCLFFFTSYAIRFHYEKMADVDMNEQYKTKQSLSIIISLFALSILVISLIVIYNYLIYDQLMFSPLLFVILLFSYIFIEYAIFIFICTNYIEKHMIRHQLIWPTVISIGLTLYFGYYFNNFLNMKELSINILIPIFIILLLFYFSFILNKKWFIIINSISISVIFISIFIGYFIYYNETKDYIDYPAFMVFCLTISSYLAVFESWRVTHHILLKERDDNMMIEDIFKRRSIQYDMSTTLALVISIVFMPLVFIFSRYGIIFLILFALHAIVAFLVWSYKDKENTRWEPWKLGFGFAFLLILIADSFFNFQPGPKWSQIFIINIFSPLVFFAITVTIFLFLYRTIELQNIEARKKRIMLLFSNINIKLCMICSLSAIFYIALVIFAKVGNDVVIINKSSFACFIYFIICLVSIIGIVINIAINGNLNRLLLNIFGIFQTTRILTSLLIGFIIFIPFALNGYNIIVSILKSVPFVFCSLGGFALNDYFDVERDKINKPNRAIPSNKISSFQGLLISIILLTLSIIISFWAFISITELSIYISSIVGIIIYNLILNRYPLIKNIFAAILCSLPILFILLSLEYSIDYYLLILSTIIFIFGRELLMDIKDIKGDKITGIYTIPNYIGEKLLIRISFIVITISNLMLIYLAIYKRNIIYFILISTSLVFIYVVSKIWFLNYGKYQRKIILALWLPMFLGLSILIL